MKESNNRLTLGEAVGRYLVTLSGDEGATTRVELQRFVHWFGKDSPVVEVTPAQVSAYAGTVSLRDPECGHKLEAVRAFLAYAAQEGVSAGNLAAHLKVKKAPLPAGKSKKASGKPAIEPQTITRAGYDAMLLELETLKQSRPAVLEEIRRAAADKDFRENAPLHAARERLGHIDGRINELEAVFKHSVVAEQSHAAVFRVAVGSEVHLVEITSGEKLCCTIVSTRETSPGQGKISCISPIGRAVMGKSKGDVVEVMLPAGKKICYRVERLSTRE
jgi:transcription elongation factor GreA